MALVGARQVPKTTLARTLDEPTRRDLAATDPVGFLRRNEPLIIDEVHRVPELFPALKMSVDADRRAGRFVLLGSANFLLMRRISETLAGRIQILELPGMTFSERHARSPSPMWAAAMSARTVEAVELCLSFVTPSESLAAASDRGGLIPAALDDDPDRRDRWLGAYVSTYVERDLRDLSQVGSLTDFRRFIGLVALRTAQVLNASDLARDSGVSVGTVRNWLGLLETSFIVRTVAPFLPNLGKRLTRAPKLHIRDAALAWHLVGVNGGEARRTHALAGSILESWIIEEILAQLSATDVRANPLYMRVHGGGEIDMVLERGARALPVEIKAVARVRPEQLKSIRMLLDDLGPDRAPLGLVIYDGTDVIRSHRDVLIVPWRHALCGAAVPPP